jgi:hypothetical protein
LCMIRLQDQVFQEASGLDQRISELQGQLDRLTVSLQLWREQQEHLKPAEDRLADLAHQCAQIIAQVSSTGERQARAVGQLEERVSAFGAAEERLHQDAAERLRALERAIEQEWSALRQIHEEPVRELRDQADVLSRITIAATNSSVSGFERAEARLAEIETALNRRLDGVSEQLAAAVAEIRAVAVRASTLPAVPAWPIEGVVRLHNQLRESNESSVGGAVVLKTTSANAPVPAAAPDVFARLESMEQALAEQQHEQRVLANDGRSRLLKLGAVMLGILALLAVAGGWATQRQAAAAAARASAAEQKAQAAVAAANAQLVAVRQQSEQQLAEAREGAIRAQAVSDVLAAPDLVRFPISGSGPNGISGQLLWSRSRGVVFSAVRLPPLPAGMTYQLWLLTDNLPVTAGTFAPGDGGRVTFTATPPAVPRPVIGAALTLEPAGGSPTPSGMLVQNRVVRPAPQE